MDAEMKNRISKAMSLPGSWDLFTNTPKSVRPSNSGEQYKLLVGPIIGKVTTTSARILVEVDKDEDVTVILLEDPEESRINIKPQRSFIRRLGSSFSRYSWRRLDDSGDGSYRFCDGSPRSVLPKTKEKRLRGKCPAVFEFEDLTPGTRYVVEVRCPDGPLVGSSLSSSFRTFPKEDPEAFSVGVISCNKFFVTKQEISPQSDLWAHLAKGIEAKKIDLLVHLGDQIYGDGDKRFDAEARHDHDRWSDRFHRAKEKLRNVEPNQWDDYRHEICESYREVYRETWQHPPTARCLANCPNLMIYDDHEIRDNWGDLANDWRRDSLDFFIAECAWIVSLEYQRQLYEDVDFTYPEKIKKDYHFHVVGHVGFMFLDIRGSRTFHRIPNDEHPYLGSQQWKDIEESLGEGGIFQEVKMLLVCSPAPLVFLHPTITSTAANTVNRLEDFKGHWSVHTPEQLRMISCLHNWKTSSTSRDILVLGGDVHCGGHSKILKSKEIAFRQLTTSAIANRPLPKSVYYTLRLVEQLGNLAPPYTFTHHHWTRARNYGIVQIRNHRSQDQGEAEFTAQLFRAKQIGIKVGIKISNHQQKRDIVWRKVSYLSKFYGSLFCGLGDRRRAMARDIPG